MKFFIEDDSGVRTELVPATGAAFATAKSTSKEGYFTGPGQPIDLLAAQSQEYVTVGSASGPCKATIHVVPGAPAIVTASFGPADGHNFAPMTGSIAGVSMSGRGVGSVSTMLALGLNGAPGADVNLTTGDHELVIQNATAGDMGEKKVVFVIQP